MVRKNNVQLFVCQPSLCWPCEPTLADTFISTACAVYAHGVCVCVSARVAPVSVCCVWELKYFMGKPKRKSRKMKIFQTIREAFNSIGINQNDRKGKIFKASFLYGFNSILNCAFLFHKAKTYRQYTDNIFMTSATIIISISFITVIVKMSRLFKFINRCERISEKSTSDILITQHTFVCRYVIDVIEHEAFLMKWKIDFFQTNSFGVSGIEKHLWWDKSTHWKLDTSHLFFCHESDTGVLDNAKVCHQHIHVLHNWHGPRCTQTTHPNVVSFTQSHTYRFQFNRPSVWFVLLVFSRNRFPFNTKNPIGYCVAIVLQYALIAYNSFLVASMVSLGVGAYLFTISMAEYIKDILNSINERAQQEDENQMKDIVSSLADFIEIHTILKELCSLGLWPYTC